MGTRTATRRSRPGLVWVISVFFGVSAVWTLMSFYLIYSNRMPVEPAQKQYFDSLTVLDYTVTILGGTLNLAGAIALFLMRRPAAYLFTVNLAIGFLVLPWHVATKGWAGALGGGSLVGAFIGWGILIAICVYSWRLLKRGQLA